MSDYSVYENTCLPSEWNDSPTILNRNAGSNLSSHEVLRRVFGYDQFRHKQNEIVDTVIKGGDALVLMPTGGGKSLCYQIPALIRPGVGVVISPLIALMKDQVDALQQSGVQAAFLNSSLSSTSRRVVEQRLIKSQLDLIYIAPERLLNDDTLQILQQIDIALFAIDEAHCVSQWGHDFRKEYQQLSILQQRFPQVPRIALTATADERTRREIVQQLSLERARVFINSFDRPNIRYKISEDTGSARNRLWEFLEREHPTSAGIVYCLSRKTVEDIANWLTSKGRESLPYHAGLADGTRKLHQERFLREDGVIICATIAFGMGIDKPDVRFVAHLNLPKSIEAYYQETGRAGRDGLPADAWMAYGLQDVISLRNMLLEADSEEFFKRIAVQKLNAMVGMCELTSCRRQAILSYFDEHLTVPCGNCDNCIEPPTTWDATVAAQKALSCVYRTGQRFGVGYLVDVLLGKTSDTRIELNGHNKTSTFGIGRDIDRGGWHAIFRQLIVRGFLETDPDGHGGLRLTDNARFVLKSEVSVHLRQRPPKRVEGRSNAHRNKEWVRSQDQPLVEALRSLRKLLAQEQGVSPFVIFHDTTLLELVWQRPKDRYGLLHITGMGEIKSARYGDSILECIAMHPLEYQPETSLNNQLSDTVTKTLLLFAKGKSPELIANERNLVISTIYGHLAEAIRAKIIDVRKVLSLTDNEYQTIVRQLRVLGICNDKPLRLLYEELGQQYSYDVIRCVLAAECV